MSYLLADMDIICSDLDPEFQSLNSYFVAFLILWLLVPLFGLMLLVSVRSSVCAQRPSNLANACRFLWRDYNPIFMYWEISDVMRKILLTALILFVDTEFGDIRLLRLWIAASVSGAYLALLALARPYKLAEDLYLACTSNLLLLCCFLSGIAIKLCEDQAWEQKCMEFLGLNGSYQTNVFVVIITVVVLVLFLTIIAVKSFMTVRYGTICLVSTGREPIMDLPASCNFHCFLSHAWRTGQDQTHTIARELQLLIPGLQVWIDVDNLSDVSASALENCVRDSAVFIIFLSTGYFRSVNCRRELYAAFAAGKPVVAVLETDRTKGGATIEALKQECKECCLEQAPAAYLDFRGPEEVIQRVFAKEPILWERVQNFQLVSLKLIALRMMRHLPFYINNPQQLEKGLQVAGELAPCIMKRPVRLLVCSHNTGAQHVAEEVLQEGKGGELISILPVSQQADLMLAEKQEDIDQMLLLYLNDRVFKVHSADSVGELVKRAMDLKITIIPVLEQDPQRGGCFFDVIYDQTAPQELIHPPYKLWDTVVIPLYPGVYHRTISLRHILKSMGAKPSRRARPQAPRNQALATNPAPADLTNMAAVEIPEQIARVFPPAVVAELTLQAGSVEYMPIQEGAFTLGRQSFDTEQHLAAGTRTEIAGTTETGGALAAPTGERMA